LTGEGEGIPQIRSQPSKGERPGAEGEGEITARNSAFGDSPKLEGVGWGENVRKKKKIVQGEEKTVCCRGGKLGKKTPRRGGISEGGGVKS